MDRGGRPSSLEFLIDSDRLVTLVRAGGTTLYTTLSISEMVIRRWTDAPSNAYYLFLSHAPHPKYRNIVLNHRLRTMGILVGTDSAVKTSRITPWTA